MAESAATTSLSQPESAERYSRMQVALVLFALATGGFAIGTGEFAIMGLLPDVASTFTVSTPVAGYVISAYALGVVVGAPTLVSLLAQDWLRR